ncbi:hypothetical protein [Bradyrhizobium sp. USDA 4508]
MREIDEKRWNKFREHAVNWEQRERMLTFLAEVEARATEADITVSDRTLRASFAGFGGHSEREPQA